MNETGVSDSADVHSNVILGVSISAPDSLLIRCYYTAEFLQLGFEYGISACIADHFLKLFDSAVLLLEFRDKIVEHGSEGQFARHPAENIKIVSMLPYEHRQQHEAPVFVDHLYRLGTLLHQDFKSQAVHRCDLYAEQAVSLKIPQSLLLCHKCVLIRHQNKRLTPVFPHTVIDETLLVYILPACK